MTLKDYNIIHWRLFGYSRFAGGMLERKGMIEVLFGDSEAASMKAAKNKNTVVIGGAKELLYSMLSQNLYGSSLAWKEELKQVGDVYVNELHRLMKFLEDGEAIRIWYSDAPYSRCGFYSLCQMLLKYETEIHVVKLPEYVAREKSIISYSHWGEVSAEEFAGFLPCEKALTREEVRMYAVRWSELSEDNSPLRAVVNGRVVGVPEDFYDVLLWKKITCEPIKEARIIGDILGCYPLGVGDWWYAGRIDYHIRQGAIMIAEDSENKYARRICLAGE